MATQNSLLSASEALLRGLAPALHLLLFICLARAGLVEKYRAFVTYIATAGLRSAILALLPIGRTIYGWVYLLTEPILWVLYGLVVLELYSLAFKEFRGIATLGKRAVSAAFVAAVVVSLATLAPDISSSHPYPYVHLSTIVGRALTGSLSLFLLVMTVFIVAFPIPVSRNVIIHSIIYCAYFLSLTLAYFIHNVFGPQVVMAVNVALGLITLGALLSWALLLKPEGETVMVKHRRQWDPEEEARLLQGLDSINAALLRVARK